MSEDRGNVLGKWVYGTMPQFPYGEDTTYKKAIEWLDGPGIIEDWGMGTGWARRFVKRGRYIGIDGSWSMHCDVVADLRTYRSEANSILMRHILEHNWDWKKILENALASFKEKFVLVMFTPFSEATHSITTNSGDIGNGVPDISFKKEDLLELIRKFPYVEEPVQSGTQYGYEHIFYIAKDASALPKIDNPLISIVIPTYNHLEDLLKPCLETMHDTTSFYNSEVIVVANGCTDGTEDYVKSLGKPFKVLSYSEPLGYTKATNEGIKAATGDFIVFINNDVVFLGQPKDQWLNQLLEPFKSNPKMGVTGPLQLRDWYAEEDVILGSCLCISREALQAAGGLLDEVYSPGGGEDIDLCCKVRKAGYIVRQVPKEGESGKQWTNVDGSFMIWHKNNQTFKDIPGYWDEIVKRNGLLNVRRYNKNIKLNLFARGVERWTYLSVDPSDKRASIIMDPAKLDFTHESVAEIIIIHPEKSHKSLDLFKEWNRVLKYGGKLIIEESSLDSIQDMPDLLNKAGFTKFSFSSRNSDICTEAIK